MSSPPSTAREDAALLAHAFRLHRAGRLAEADDAYERYLAAHPDDAAALNNAAALALQAGRHGLAVRRFEQAVALAPDQPQARNNLGYALTVADRPLDAIFHLERAVQLDPSYAAAYNNLGIALERAGDRREAILAFDRALALDARYADAATNLGRVRNNDGDAAGARAAFAHALAVNPAQPYARTGLMFAQMLEGDLDGARAGLEARVAEVPPEATFWQTLGTLRFWSGDFAAAEDAYRDATARDPANAEAQAGLACALLAQGHFVEGWRAFEQRPEGRFGPAIRFPELPVWTGAPLDGTLLLLADHGLGDVIQYSRFVPDARKRVGEIAFVADDYWAPLAPVLASLAGVDHLLRDAALVAGLPRRPAARASVASLPFLLGILPETLPGPIPYLRAPADRAAVWAPRLHALPRPRVGLVWAGKARGDHSYLTRHKSIPLGELAPLVATRGVSFVSLQTGPAGDRSALGPLADNVADLAADIHDFGDTAAIVDGLDLVVSVDTSVAHLAGAMGKPVFLLDRYNADWRWRMPPGQATWYPSVRIFRQHRFLDWSGAVAAAKAALANFAADGTLAP